MPVYIKRYISQEVSPQSITSLFKDSSDLELFALVSVSRAPEGYAQRAPKFVWDAILEDFKGTNGSVVDKIKKGITGGSKKLLEMIKNDKSVDQDGIDLSFAVIAVKEATAYLGVFGEQEIFVSKNGSYVNVGEILSKNRVTAASFALAPSDLVMVSSPTVFSRNIANHSSEEINELLLEISDTLQSGQGLFILSRTPIETDFSEIEPVEIDDVVIPDEERVSQEVDIVADVENIDTPMHMEDLERVEGDLEVSEEMNEVKVEKREVKKEFDVKELGLKVRDWWARVRNFFIKAWNTLSKSVSPVIEKVGRVLSGLGNRLSHFMDNQYGRKVWYKRIKSRLSTMKLSKGGSAYGMKIDRYKETSLRTKRFGVIGIAIVLIIVVVGGVRLSINAKEARELHRQATAIFESIDPLIKQAELNASSDPDSTETLVFQINEELAKLKDKELSIDDSQKYSEYKGSVGKIEDRLAKRIWIDENDRLQTYLSTRIEFGSESSPTDITVYKNDYQTESIFVTDKGNKAVYRVYLYDKKVVKIPDKNGLIKSPLFVDVGTKGVYVYDEVSGVVRSQFDNNNGNADFESLTGLGAEDLDVGGVEEFAVFMEVDNIYMLSSSNPAIYRSDYTGNGYSLPYSWISLDSFTGASDFFGDLSIYILNPNTVMDRFSYNYVSGKSESNPVTVSGAVLAVKEPVGGFTWGTLDNYLYMFEGGENSRLLAFEKPKEGVGDLRHPNEMVLVNEYKYGGASKDIFKNVQDIVADYQEKYVYILDGTVIYSVELSK